MAHIAFELVRQRGVEVTTELLAKEAGMSRHRLETIFADEAEIFDAVAELWFRPLTALMEEVLACNLPANRKLYEFFARRFVHVRAVYRDDPAFYLLLMDFGSRHFERVRSYIDLADHYLCELIAQAQDEGFFDGLEIDRALTLINQMVACYTVPRPAPDGRAPPYRGQARGDHRYAIRRAFCQGRRRQGHRGPEGPRKRAAPPKLQIQSRKLKCPAHSQDCAS